ncbi:hypothetical protein OMP38_28545 [Cohnella ginsengisoli]|uniref:Uncharacterized protein n=1 Tax=Cohnella ginsengisoli TaxID=425004 RepID=A0A9X4QQB2_9BACL|nr:hypothetical protein [Cohnella ginsengisoli]MDG0794346.1 hypothetical protein [Cohnella ginsengisoli]
MSIKLFGTVLLAVVLLAGGLLLNGPLTPSFALSPAEQIVPLPPVHLDLPAHGQDDAAGGPADQGDAARLLSLMNAADAVVTGTVIAEAHALDGNSAVTTLEVRDWLKGGTSRYIRIVQSPNAGGSLLCSGESYLLMLRADQTQAPDVYRIAGKASEGKFAQQDGRWANDDPLLTTALQAWSQKQPAALVKKLAA